MSLNISHLGSLDQFGLGHSIALSRQSARSSQRRDADQSFWLWFYSHCARCGASHLGCHGWRWHLQWLRFSDRRVGRVRWKLRKWIWWQITSDHQSVKQFEACLVAAVAQCNSSMPLQSPIAKVARWFLWWHFNIFQLLVHRMLCSLRLLMFTACWISKDYFLPLNIYCSCAVFWMMIYLSLYIIYLSISIIYIFFACGSACFPWSPQVQSCRLMASASRSAGNQDPNLLSINESTVV